MVDASDAILGRLASVAAKKALLGEEVMVVNCEKAIITGKKKDIIAKHMQRFELGQSTQGPFFPKRPDMFVRRVIRGMVPRKKARGRAAFKRVRCFIGVPEGLGSQKLERVAEAGVRKASTVKFITVRELCRLIGGK
ncbi:50S ribosomal protein L13 [Candidatus Woesearchaeota archaeon]|nr:50S ribosomal protein L13 [Candidatus Woesearchaeota archaeon]